MVKRKNVIVFCTDQQRGDSLGCMGNSIARTPNLDRLASRGVLYTQHYSTNPVCMPSRCAFITGRYPQANGVIDNGIDLPNREVTMPQVFHEHGYNTAVFGKLHFQTCKTYEGDVSHESYGRWNSGELQGWTGPYYGFEHVLLTVGHGEDCTGAYGWWRKNKFPDLKLGVKNAHGTIAFPQFACWKSNMPVEAHHSTWVADQAIKYLDEIGDSPFYIQVSFPDPHHPFTPPAPYHSMFDDVEFPTPHAVEGENETKPKPYREAMFTNPFPTDGGAHFSSDLKGDAYHQVLAHTYAMNTLIDYSIGRMISKLEENGLMQNTIIVFMSDHGDFMGDHHFLYKGQMPCRSLLNVPLIIFDSDYGSGVVDAVCSNVDVMPTLLNACNITVPDCVQGVVLPCLGESPKRDYAFEAGWSKASSEYHHYTIYKQDWRISVFPNLRDGELYDLKNDPFEHRNLFNDPDYRMLRLDLMEELLFAVGSAETPHPYVVTDW